MFLVTGLFGGVFASVASATTTPATFKLTMTSGTFGVHSNVPLNALQGGTRSAPVPASITGKVSAATGAISDASLSTNLWFHESPSQIDTQSTETVILSQVTGGTATGTINHTGDVTFSATLSILITIVQPADEQCLSTPVKVTLDSTAPYNTSTHEVTLSDTSFTIPNFPTSSSAGNCSLAHGLLNTRFAGSTGNAFTLALHGTLPLPPPPAAATTTAMTVSPTSPVLVGTPVTLSATVSSSTTSGTLGATTSRITFKTGTTQLGAPQPVVAGKARVTTSSLTATAAQQLTAVYSGNSKFAASTSAATSYTVQPKPSVIGPFPSALVTGAASPTKFSLTVTNPSTGENWSNLWLKFTFTGIATQNSLHMSLSYKNASTTWCPITLSGASVITGTFKGAVGSCSSATEFPLTAGHPLTVTLELSYTSAARVGVQRVSATLETVSGGTVVAPLKGATSVVAKGTFQVNPATRYNLTPGSNISSTPVPQGYVVKPEATLRRPSSPTGLPLPTGTVSYIVGGVTLATSKATNDALTLATFPTTSLSIGTHSLVIQYPGDGVYNPVSYTTSFTVAAPAPGTPFSCLTNSQSGAFLASVVVSANVPKTVVSGMEIPVSALQVTLNMTPVHGVYTTTTTLVTTVKLGFSPVGGTITFTGSAGTLTVANGVSSITWTGLSTSIPVTGSPGTVVNVGVSSVFLRQTRTITCVPVSQAAPLATVTISGVTLAASPSGQAVSGAPVTLTATVAPAPVTTGTTKRPILNGQVTFFDMHYTSATKKTVTTNVGTLAVVDTDVPTLGTVSLVLAPPLGAHVYTAKWSGTGSVPSSTSNSVDYLIGTAPKITGQPSSLPVNLGKTITFKATATGSPTPTVQWQVLAKGASTWTTVSGATAGTYTVTATTTDNGSQYRAVFTNTFGTATTNPVTLNVVVPPSITAQPASTTVNAGQTATFSAGATGTVPSVQWQVSTDAGSTWSNAPGTPTNTFVSATTVSSTYTTPVTTGSDSGDQYRALFTNAAAHTVPSTAATLTVNTGPVIVTQPVNDTVNAGQTAVFYAAGSSSPSPTVQWQVSTDGGSTWSNITGATSDLLAVPTVGTDNANQYRAVFTNVVGTSASNAATLTVNVNGYRLIAANGSVFAYGDAAFYGSMGGKSLSAPIVGTASTPGDGGYWLVGSDGGIFSFGNAQFHGSMGGQPLNKPIVGMAATPTGGGYWEVASDGGIFAFGNAKFYGSTGSMTLNKPIVGMAATPTGGGYWEVASDGGIFSFGNAQFFGTVAGTTTSSITGLAVTPTGDGYWEVAANGQVFQFGDATSAGTALTQTATIVAISE